MINWLELQIDEYSIFIDIDDLHIIENGVWSISEYGYVRGSYKGVPHKLLHRIILNYDGPLNIDHINNNKLDNRKCNLRLCTHQQNACNKQKQYGLNKNQSNYRGVSFFRRNGKWLSKIKYKGKQYFLGYYNNQEDAARAYDKKAKELHGEFANLNFNT